MEASIPEPFDDISPAEAEAVRDVAFGTCAEEVGHSFHTMKLASWGVLSSGRNQEKPTITHSSKHIDAPAKQS